MKTFGAFILSLLSLLLPATAAAQEIGDSTETVRFRHGTPSMERVSGTREIWLYGDGAKVAFEGGKVVEYVPAPAVSPKKTLPKARASDRSRRIEKTATDRGQAPEETEPETITIGDREIRTAPIALSVMLFYGLFFLGLNQFSAERRWLGAIALALAFGISFFQSIFLAVAASGGDVRGTQLIRLILTIGLMVGIWRGSSRAFGTFVVLSLLGATIGGIMAFSAKSWFLLTPPLVIAGTVAILLSKPVGGFLDRDNPAKQKRVPVVREQRVPSSVR
jgi:hypothetical protein